MTVTEASPDKALQSDKIAGCAVNFAAKRKRYTVIVRNENFEV